MGSIGLEVVDESGQGMLSAGAAEQWFFILVLNHFLPI
jgi:hypothetical protein